MQRDTLLGQLEQDMCAKMLKCNGGLGIIDLDTIGTGYVSVLTPKSGIADQMAWKISHEREGILASTLRQLYNILEVSHLLTGNHSSVLKQLSELSHFYDNSIRTTGQADWRWSAMGLFTSASAYKAMHNRGVIFVHHRVLWKLKTPMKVRIFLWLMWDDKILTQEVLTGRGYEVQHGCVLCGSSTMETRDHLFLTCPYALRFWRGMTSELSLPQLSGSDPYISWWKARRRLGGEQKKRWDVVWAVGTWALWKERNRRTFSQLC